MRQPRLTVNPQDGKDQEEAQFRQLSGNSRRPGHRRVLPGAGEATAAAVWTIGPGRDLARLDEPQPRPQLGR